MIDFDEESCYYGQWIEDEDGKLRYYNLCIRDGVIQLLSKDEMVQQGFKFNKKVPPKVRFMKGPSEFFMLNSLLKYKINSDVISEVSVVSASTYIDREKKKEGEDKLLNINKLPIKMNNINSSHTLTPQTTLTTPNNLLNINKIEEEIINNQNNSFLEDLEFLEITQINEGTTQGKINLKSKDFDRLTYKIFSSIKEVYKYYIESDEQVLYDLFPLWILGSYLFPIFNAYPYIIINAPKNSGKSKCLELSSLLSFNGVLSVSISPSALFRIIDAYKPSLFIDEVEALSKTEIGTELKFILQGGYKKGGFVLRSLQQSSKSGDFKTQEFPSYCPKMLANIGGFDATLESRAIFINLKRALTEVGEREIYSEDESYISYRDDIYFWAFNRFKKVREIYKNLQNPTTLKNRDFEIWKPLFSIAILMNDKEIYKLLIEFATQNALEKREEDITTNPDLIIINKLFEEVKRGYLGGYVKSYKIMEIVQNELMFPMNLWSLGKTMKRLGFYKRRMGAGMEYLMDQKFVYSLKARYIGIDEGDLDDTPKL